jgi:hypothetical protein
MYPHLGRCRTNTSRLLDEDYLVLQVLSVVPGLSSAPSQHLEFEMGVWKSRKTRQP